MSDKDVQETPVAEQPQETKTKVEEAKAEAPKVEEVKAEAPKVEEPKAEAPKVEEVKAEAPKVEEVKAEAPKVEEAKTEAPKVEEVKAEAPKVEEVKAEAPKVEEAKAEAPKVEEVKAEAPKVEEAKAEAPKVEEVKTEAPKAEEVKAEAPKAEEAKAEAPKAEEAKAEEVKADEAGEKKKPARRTRTNSRRKPRQSKAADKKVAEESAPEAAAPEAEPVAEAVVEPAAKVAFASFDMPTPIMKAIKAAGFEHCTDIQAQTLPHTLLGKDCIGKAQTGTGKTAAFLLSVLTDMIENPLPQQYNGEPRALVLAPTRELAQQIAADAQELTKFAKLNVVTVVGGMDFEKQKQQLIGNKVDLLVATPGRLIDFVQRRNVYLDQIEVLVIDEADRMLDMGFIPDLRQIVRATPRKEVRQTLMFSATFTEQVMRLARSWTLDPVTIEIEPKMKTSDRVEQHVYLTSNDDKFQILKNLLESEAIERAMVFANRRDLVRNLTEELKRAGIDCAMLSGEVSQDKRVKVLNRFKSGEVKVMVATDVAGRGIHVDGVSHVVNYTLPEDAEDYVHRIGRTGRAGAKGLSVSFACEDDSFLIPDLEKYLGNKIELERPPEALLVKS